MRPSKTAISFLLFTVFAWGTLNSQKLRFKQITAEDGLSSNFVRTIVQDGSGFMWFGTQDGLNRYDGYQIRVFRNERSGNDEAVIADVTTLLQIDRNLLLVGTKEGLYRFYPLTGKFEGSVPIVSGKINALLSLDTGHVLVGTTQGLTLLNLKTDSAASLNFDGLNKAVNALGLVNDEAFIGTATDGLWHLGTAGSLQKVRLVVPEYMNVDTSALNSVNVIRQYGGRMYLGTNGGGIYKFDWSMELQGHISFAGLSRNTNVIRDFIIHNNSIFAATAYGAVTHHLISGRTEFYTRQEAAQSLNSNPCNSILADRQNNVWIGTDLGGVNVAMHRSLRFPLSPYSYETNFQNVYTFLETSPGKVIVGGVRTLHEISLENGRVTDLSGFLKDGTARCLLAENKDILWVGTWGNGLFRYNRRNGKAVNVFAGKGGGTILTLFIHEGVLFAGSAGEGLFRIDLSTLEIQHFGAEEGLPVLSINDIFLDEAGAMWLGTYDGGLLKLSVPDTSAALNVEQVYTNKGRPGDIASNVVFQVNQATDKSIWAATSRGLSKLMPDGTFTTFRQKDGLPGTYLYSLVKDSVDHFWMSSNVGLIRFDPAMPGYKATFKTYGLKDGLLNTAYNMGAAFSSASGLMYFGGSKGFNVFRPTSIKDNYNKPPVFVVGYKSGGRDVTTDTMVAFKKHLQLSWEENSFQFELAALDFTDAEQNMFSYKLEGYDKNWSLPGRVRFVSYTELPGGTYTFRVKAANNDGIWNDTPYETTITVVPPFWKTSLFYALVLIAFVVLVFGFIRFRTRAIRRENALLEHKVAERTKELEIRNREVTSSIEYAKRIQEAILPVQEQVFSRLGRAFILYKPKDIVSGDFYWFSEKGSTKIFAVVDCTGHGVPGAFMSMIGHNLLDQVVTENGVTDPGEILNHLHKGVLYALRQDQPKSGTHDGMDVSIISLDDKKGEVRWAGANRPLLIVDRDGNLSRHEGTKSAVGGAQTDVNRVFKTHVIARTGGAMAYLYSDGYADQFGGERGKKFMAKRFHDLLRQIHDLEPGLQKMELERNFENWRSSHEQVDDVLVAGIEI